MAWASGLLVVLNVSMLAVFLQFQVGDCDFINDETTLRAQLLSNYNVDVRPDSKTNVTVYGYILSLNDLDIARQTMSVNIIFDISWYDGQLVWNSTNYGGCERLTTPPEQIWTPSIVIQNAVNNIGAIGGKKRDATPLRIHSNGRVLWFPPAEIRTSCEMTITHYPFDTQVCSLQFMGWSYPVADLNITVVGIDTDKRFSPNGEFDFTRSRVYQRDVGGPSEEYTYRSLYIELTIRRKWQFYGQNLLMPIVLNSILMNAVFALPIDSGEKMGYCLTVLLSYVVFLTWVTENLPPVSTDTSILQIYMATVLGLCSIATLLTMWVLRLYHTSPDKPVSPFYRKFASAVLVPFSQLTHCGKKKTKVAHGDDLDPPAYTSKVAPLPSPPKLVASQEPTRVFYLSGDSKSASITEVEEIYGSDDSEEEITPTYNWRELSALLDYFCLWMFGAVLVIITALIFGLMYASY